MTPLLARLAETAAGTSPPALRVLPALAAGTVTVLAATMAGRFEGGRRARVFAAATTAFAGITLAVRHLLATVTFDLMFWTAGCLLLVRRLDGEDPRWWIALGGVIGVGLLNKHLMAAFALAISVAVTARRLLTAVLPWVGGATWRRCTRPCSRREPCDSSYSPLTPAVSW